MSAHVCTHYYVHRLITVSMFCSFSDPGPKLFLPHSSWCSSEQGTVLSGYGATPLSKRAKSRPRESRSVVVFWMGARMTLTGIQRDGLTVACSICCNPLHKMEYPTRLPANKISTDICVAQQQWDVHSGELHCSKPSREHRNMRCIFLTIKAGGGRQISGELLLKVITMFSVKENPPFTKLKQFSVHAFQFSYYKMLW